MIKATFMAKTNLKLGSLKQEARIFLTALRKTPVKALYGVSDGKAVGTHVEHEFHAHLQNKYIYERGSSASGIDFPALGGRSEGNINRAASVLLPISRGSTEGLWAWLSSFRVCL